MPVPTIELLDVLFTCWKSTCGRSELNALIVVVEPELDSVVVDIAVMVDVDAEVAKAATGSGAGVDVGV